ncbi:MAG: nicotinate-nucleotide adenylyltransferase [Thermodesulfobacteriota bacterium]
MSDPRLKIGLLGGTFDPCHNGHLALAEAAADFCSLNRIDFIPAAQPPHKDRGQLTDYHHRARMVELAIKGRQRFILSEVESRLPLPSYTVDTLKYYRERYDDRCSLYFIIGRDAFVEIELWKKYREVLSLSHFIVFSRHGFENSLMPHLLEKLGYIEEKNFWYNPLTTMRIYQPSFAAPEISSSTIRELLGHSPSQVKDILPPSVADYIFYNQLYGTQSTAS